MISGEIILALSVKWDRRIKHFVFNQDESGMYYFESHKVGEIEALPSFTSLENRYGNLHSGNFLTSSLFFFSALLSKYFNVFMRLKFRPKSN